MFKTPLIVGFAWLLLSGGGLADEARSKELFAWFDGLGYPGLHEGPQLVRVATGRWFSRNGGPPQNRFADAFLLDEDAEKFRVISLDLGIASYQKTPAGTPEHLRIGFRPADLKGYAEKLLAMAAEGDGDALRTWARHNVKLPLEAQLFVLARACQAQDRSEFAEKLLALSEANSNWRSSQREQYKLRIVDDLSLAELWRATLRFGNPKISRVELLKDFSRITERFPESRYFEDAKRAQDLLTEMVEEDRMRADEPQPDTLEGDEKIAALIFQLRDQNGAQRSQPGACDIFLFDRIPSAPPSPAQQLVDIGFAAVPQLIEALDDERFTRSVGYGRNFKFSHHVLRVSDCAAVILWRFSGWSFRLGRGDDRPAMCAAAKVDAKLWWKGVQAQGESKFLAERIVRAEQKSVDHATWLARRFPQEALGPIDKGIRNSEDAWTRSNFVRIAGGLPGDAPLELLRREMRNGPDRKTRASAATALWERGKPEALDAMINGWKKRPKVDPGGWADWGNALDAHIEFLANCGEVSAIEALGDRFVESPVRWRYDIVREMHTGVRAGDWRAIDPRPAKVIPEDLRAAIEALLMIALGDTAEFDQMTGKWDEISFSNPRICDLAGHVLAQRWPDKFQFDLGASAEQRELQRERLIGQR